MLKKSLLYLTLVICFGFGSCKKKYSCLCSTTFTKTGYSPYTVASTKEIDSKVNKKTAERICTQTEKQSNKNDADYVSGNETVSVSCALK